MRATIAIGSIGLVDIGIQSPAGHFVQCYRVFHQFQAAGATADHDYLQHRYLELFL